MGKIVYKYVKIWLCYLLGLFRHCDFIPCLCKFFHLTVLPGKHPLHFSDSLCLLYLLKSTRIIAKTACQTLYPLGKITSRGRPEDVPKKRPNVLRTSSYGPIRNAKRRICSWTSI